MSTERQYNLIHLTCAHCGAGLELPEDSHVCRCAHCGNSFLLVGSEGALQYYVPHTIDSDMAQHIVWQRLKVLQRTSDAVMHGLTLYYVPYWRLRGTVIAWVFGRKPLIEKGTELKQHYDPQANHGGSYITTIERVVGDSGVEKLFRRSAIVTISACNVQEMGIEPLTGQRQAYGCGNSFNRNAFLSMRLLDLAAKPAEGVFLSVTVPLEQAKSDAEIVFTHLLQGAVFDLDEISYQTQRTLTGHISMVYYPIWFCRFSVQGRQFTATLDGTTGKIIAGSLSSNRYLRVQVILFALVLANIVATPIAKFLMVGSENSAIILLLFMLIVLGAICYFAWHTLTLQVEQSLVNSEETPTHSV